ncbi:antitoxin VbhA family protein [uncultured Holdemanella sp.]|uniref:antitoxin VbhA family protein n=1 Tax=uncultured Holdemanella sp. TaxID=1763549 RepID=UPI00258C706D|nr:antitoxin VbhA family protein [uncultured Holdemanella sp.]
MIIKNTEAGRKVQQVAATMAIEDMYVSKEFIEKLLKVSNGEMTSEQLRKEVLKEYAQE